MLVLARRDSESIYINDDIKLTIVEIGPSQVKIGFEAPKDVRINRAEVWHKINRQSKKYKSLTASLGDDNG